MCRPAQRIKIVLAGALGGVLPEIDALSLRSGFDRTIGQWLGLKHSGVDIYFGSEWYSHQAFFHSLLGLALVTGTLWWLASFFYTYMMRHARDLGQAAHYLAPYFIALGSGYLLHLMLDLFTPAGPWGGIQLFFPLDRYVGGWGMIWWWNNYDIFLLLMMALVINVVSMISFSVLNRAARLIPSVIAICALLSIAYQVNTRDFNFNQKGYVGREQASHRIQQHTLNPQVYEWMTWVDEQLPVYF